MLLPATEAARLRRRLTENSHRAPLKYKYCRFCQIIRVRFAALASKMLIVYFVKKLPLALLSLAELDAGGKNNLNCEKQFELFHF